jgi:GNAT superfamily N-acetyltransferase
MNFVNAATSRQLDSVRQLFMEYQAGLGIDLDFQGFEEELNSLPGIYSPPAGRLYLIEVENEVAGCGALKPLSPSVCELKRIYVRPRFRRRGLAEAISEQLLADALEEGYQIAKLDTLARLRGAVALYRKLGFSETSAYNFNPHPDILYFERRL